MKKIDQATHSETLHDSLKTTDGMEIKAWMVLETESWNGDRISPAQVTDKKGKNSLEGTSASG